MPFIFPSLSRAPEFANTKSVEDGTLADPMESGYVATRPRFTRLRRKFGVSYKFLSPEDVRALDFFETQVVKGKAGAFYMPNQLANGSFELPGVWGVGILGWVPHPSAAWSVGTTSAAYDGARAALFTQNAAETGTASISAALPVQVTVGESYQFRAHVNIPALASNILNPANIIVPGYVNSATGAVSTNGFATWGASGLIPVMPGQVFTTNFVLPNVGPSVGVAYYLNGTYVSGVAYTGTLAGVVSFTVPAGVNQLRVTIPGADASTAGSGSAAFIPANQMVWTSAVLPSLTVPYGTASVSLALSIILNYADGTTQTLTAALGSAATLGYQAFCPTVAIPASTKTATVAAAHISLRATIAGAAAGATIAVDNVGFALCAPVQAFGRMPGQPLGSQVRFTKTPQVKDAGWFNGAPAYDVSFEVTEV